MPIQSKKRGRKAQTKPEPEAKPNADAAIDPGDANESKAEELQQSDQLKFSDVIDPRDAFKIDEIVTLFKVDVNNLHSYIQRYALRAELGDEGEYVVPGQDLAEWFTKYPSAGCLTADAIERCKSFVPPQEQKRVSLAELRRDRAIEEEERQRREQAEAAERRERLFAEYRDVLLTEDPSPEDVDELNRLASELDLNDEQVESHVSTVAKVREQRELMLPADVVASERVEFWDKVKQAERDAKALLDKAARFRSSQEHRHNQSRYAHEYLGKIAENMPWLVTPDLKLVGQE